METPAACRQWEGDWRSWNLVCSGDTEQNNQLLILDGKTFSHYCLTHTLTCGKLPFSHAWSPHLLTEKKKKHSQTHMKTHTISHEHIIHAHTHTWIVDTGSTLCGPLAVCITGRFKANYYKNKHAKHFLWCPLPRTTLRPSPETIRGRGDTEASTGGAEEEWVKGKSF